MIYVIRATERVEPGTGSFEVAAKTEEDALKMARDLRSQGLKVQIFGPQGERIDRDGADWTSSVPE
jgi:hypothetical protein